ncbi:hypothetical protein [Algoriphagus boritolerans]|uniref:Transglutaminase-like superfamily protein n=1 Tax=Algoriphagus boritolerans DSM 17298 = JCM 18970 TaxID=1120964 RepID=A0A1H6AK59_9BACT|nr:hypothetical protein [Algoriphagus boritolerans]SEG48554.1 hypothetical protein SAMN03080598_04167 [Algoriphagus boritolerans DSM 17298 = JCM 18970]
MKKALLILLTLTGLVRGTLSQELFTSDENLNFHSESEKVLWQTGKKDPFLLFRAVQADHSELDGIWTDLVSELDLKASKKKNDYKFLRAVFEKTHQHLLKKYEQHATFNSMLKEGRYDCVSGSAALGLLLERYGYSFDIVETDYHVFIVVHLGLQKAILESTLPIGGLITTPSEVEKYLDSYKPAEFAQPKSFNQRLAGHEIDYSDNSIFRKVDLKQLAGLQYYNDAIVYFNSQAFGQAVDQLSKAYLLYPSDRILGLRELSIELAYKTFGYELKK